MRGPAVVAKLLLLLLLPLCPCLALGRFGAATEEHLHSSSSSSSTITPLVARDDDDHHHHHHQLSKRAWPHIEWVFFAQQQQQLRDAFKDAIWLARQAISAIDNPADPIFTKYFSEADRALVRGVFDAIVPEGIFGTVGSVKLGGLYIRKDYIGADGEKACINGRITAELRNYASLRPNLVMCDLAFKLGGIGKAYPGAYGQPVVAGIDCDSIGDRISWRMETLGFILLHEYTHMTVLVSPPLHKETGDYENGYGPVNTRILDKALATDNADSYAWFANEAFWTAFCGRRFANPRFEDQFSPYCEDTDCEDSLSSEPDPDGSDWSEYDDGLPLWLGAPSSAPPAAPLAARATAPAMPVQGGG